MSNASKEKVMPKSISKTEFVKVIKNIRKMIKSGKYSKCSCPKKKCEWHGNCYLCVMQHRYFGKHVPNCLQFIINAKIAALAETAELEVKRKPMTPDSYWEYVKKTAPKDKSKK